jgi:translation elongation factor EF-Ts
MMIVVACETDFVAKTDAFKKYGEDAVDRIWNLFFGKGEKKDDLVKAVEEMEKPYIEELILPTKEVAK